MSKIKNTESTGSPSDTEERNALIVHIRAEGEEAGPLPPLPGRSITLALRTRGCESQELALSSDLGEFDQRERAIATWRAEEVLPSRGRDEPFQPSISRIWHLFVHPSSRQLFVDWEQAAHHAVMSFRAIYDRHAGDEWFELFLVDLQQASPEFRTWWLQHDVQWSCDPHHEKELDHPQFGRLILSSTTLIAPDAPTLKMVIFTPCSQDTIAKLATIGKTEHPVHSQDKSKGGLPPYIESRAVNLLFLNTRA